MPLRLSAFIHPGAGFKPGRVLGARQVATAVVLGKLNQLISSMVLFDPAISGTSGFAWPGLTI